ncbi:hypothetical protein [Neobacillus cucumis]|uniref:Lipoprotein n=1 Tax=Neobacillus cucumis TaxID=1740721 RepID=A0A2N5HFP5_9BACI|nr:hypothetical protein [Neobacillus cucumis]PLS04327.1 hypothetical protein CVD27_11815 [Neobacillus cucumis]
MKKMFFFLGLSAILILSACGREPLKSRNLIEADQYIRNNINDMSWSQFQLLLNPTNHVSEKDFKVLKKIISSNNRTSYVEVDHLLYRFNDKQKLMYMTEWAKRGSVFYLKDIKYVNR